MSAPAGVDPNPEAPKNELDHLVLAKKHLACASKLKGKNTIPEDEIEEYELTKSDFRNRFNNYIGVPPAPVASSRVAEVERPDGRHKLESGTRPGSGRPIPAVSNIWDPPDVTKGSVRGQGSKPTNVPRRLSSHGQDRGSKSARTGSPDGNFPMRSGPQVLRCADEEEDDLIEIGGDQEHSREVKTVVNREIKKEKDSQDS